MNLRPYQSRAVRAVREARLAGHRRIVLVSPTGSGKTVLLSTMTLQAVAQGKRVAWFVNRRELVTQSVRTLERFGLDVGSAGVRATAPVQVCTYQGAVAGGEVPPADVVMLDEAHHLSERNEWASIPRAYPEAVVLGATATPERTDGHGLDHLFQHLIVVAQASELVELGALVKCDVLRPNRELNGLARTPAKATLLHKLRDHRQVVFAPHVKAAEEYAAQFREIGMTPAVVTGTTPKEERDALFAAFRTGRVNPLVGCQVFTEGWDEPSVEVVTLAGKCGSIGSMIQKVGRGLRPSPNKSRCVVLDLTGCTHTLGHPLMDREFSLEGEGISGPPVERVRLSVCKRCGAQMPDDGDTCATPGCGWKRPALEVPRSLEERLEKWEHRRQDVTDDRVAKMVGWIRAAQHRGQRNKAVAIAVHTYAGWYREKAPADVIGHACAIVAGRQWCASCRHSMREGKCRCVRAA